MSEEVVTTADTLEPPQKKVGVVKVAGVLGVLGGIALGWALTRLASVPVIVRRSTVTRA